MPSCEQCNSTNVSYSINSGSTKDQLILDYICAQCGNKWTKEYKKTPSSFDWSNYVGELRDGRTYV